MNNVVLIGRLTRDPELRYIPHSGTAVCNFTLAVDKQLSKDKKEEMEAKNQPTADFIRITTWGKLAESSANHLAKGLLTAVQGRIQTGSYKNDNGETRYTFDVVANSVQFLEWKNNKQNNQSNDGFSGESEIEGFQPTSNDDLPF